MNSAQMTHGTGSLQNSTEVVITRHQIAQQCSDVMECLKSCRASEKILGKAEQHLNDKNWRKMHILGYQIGAGTHLNIPQLGHLEMQWLVDNFSYLGLCRSAGNPFMFILVIGFKTIQPSTITNSRIHELFKYFYPVDQRSTAPAGKSLNLGGVQTYRAPHEILQLQSNYQLFNQIWNWNNSTAFQITSEDRDKVSEFQQINGFKSEIEKEFQKCFEILVLMTNLAPETQLHKSQSMDKSFFLDWVRTIQTKQLIKETAYYAYDMAITAMSVNQVGFNNFLNQFQQTNVKESIIQNIMNQTGKHGETLELKWLHQFFLPFTRGEGQKSGVKNIHPSPFTMWAVQSSDYVTEGCLELIWGAPEQIGQFMQVALWISRVLFPKPIKVGNNNASLCLMLEASTGKSTIANAMKEAFGGYLYEQNGNFQSPEVTNAGAVIIQDVTWQAMKSAQYKNLTDFQEPLKLQAKFQNSVDTTYQCPIIISTNENMIDRYRAEQTSSTDGVLRRLFIIDFHTPINELWERGTNQEAESFRVGTLLSLNSKKLMNTLIAIAITIDEGVYQPSINHQLYHSFKIILTAFQKTHFGKLLSEQMKNLVPGTNQYFQSIIGKTVEKVKRTNDRQRNFERVTVLDDSIRRILMDWGNNIIFNLPAENQMQALQVLRETMTAPLWERNWKIAKHIENLNQIQQSGFDDEENLLFTNNLNNFWKHWFKTAESQFELRFESPVKSESDRELERDIEKSDEIAEELAQIHRRQIATDNNQSVQEMIEEEKYFQSVELHKIAEKERDEYLINKYGQDHQIENRERAFEARARRRENNEVYDLSEFKQTHVTAGYTVEKEEVPESSQKSAALPDIPMNLNQEPESLLDNKIASALAENLLETPKKKEQSISSKSHSIKKSERKLRSQKKNSQE